MNILMALSQKEVTGAETYAVQITEEFIKQFLQNYFFDLEFSFFQIKKGKNILI